MQWFIGANAEILIRLSEKPRALNEHNACLMPFFICQNILQRKEFGRKWSFVRLNTASSSLLEEYKQTLSDTKQLVKKLQTKKKKIEQQIEPNQEDLLLIKQDLSIANSWLSNISYCIDWLNTGRRPGSTRGAERRAAYERERPFDPIVMQRFFRSEQSVYHWDESSKESVVSESENELILEALSVLSDREQEVYLMSRGHSLTQEAISQKMCLSRSSVQTMLKRADIKIAKFCFENKERRQLS